MSLLSDLQGMYDPAAKQLNLNLGRLGALGASLSKSTRSATLQLTGVASAPEEKAGIIAFSARSLAIGDARAHIVFPAAKTTAASCSIYQADSNPVLVISCKLTPDWRFTDSLPGLQFTFWDDLALKQGVTGFLLLSTGPIHEPTLAVQLSEGIQFYGALDELQGLLQSASWILGVAPKALGPITLYDDRAPAISLGLQVANPEDGFAGLFSNLKMPVAASLNSNLGQGQIPDGLLLTTTIPWAGQNIKLDALIPSQTTSIVELSVEGKLPLPSPDDIARYLGGNSVTAHLPDQFSKALSSIHVSKVTLGIGLGSQKLEYARVVLSALEDSKLTIVPRWVEVSNLRFKLPVFFGPSGPTASYSLSGTLDIGGVDLLVSAQLVPTPRVPDLTVVVQLDELDEINLTQIARKFGLPAGAPQILVTEFQMGASTAGTFFVRSSLSEHPLGPSQSAFVMSNLIFELDYDGSQAMLYVEGDMTVAGVPVNLSLSNSGGWVFQGTAGGDEGSIPLGSFIQSIAQDLGSPAPQELVQAVQGIQIKNLQVIFDTGQKSFQFIADTVAKGRLPFGAKSYELDTRIQLLSLVDSSTCQRSFTGHLEADFQIGKAKFVVSFDFGPGAKVFKGQWRSTDGTTVGFADIAEALGIPHAVTVPQGLDLGLKSACFEYRSADSTFILAAESRLFGDAFFTAGKGQSGGWGFIFGVNFPPQAKLSSLPVIGNDLKAADFLTFKQSAVMLASTTFKNVVLPALPALPPQQIPGAAQSLNIPSPGRTVKPVASGATLQLNPGLSLAATLDFGASSSDAKTKNLQSIVGGDELLLQISMGQAGLSLYASLSGKVGIPSGAGKLALTNPAVRIDLTTVVVFQLSGGMSFVINGAKIVATARLIISETEAQVAVDISGDHSSLPAPPGVKGLHIQNFGMVMGVYFEPPGLDLGLQGKFRIGEVQGTRDNELAIVLQVIEELPNILYLSFYVDRMDLGQVVTLFTNQTEPAIVQSMEIVKASDLSFHWSEGVVALPDGSIAQPGFGFSASIQIFNFGAHADLEVSVGNGVSGRAEMASVNLKGVLVITGDGTGISRTYQQLNGQWQLVNNDSIVRQKPAPPTRKEVIVGPGGPIIEFNGLHSPFVHVNWQVTLFDVQKIRTDVTISSSGFFFVLTYDLGEIERFNLNCTLKDHDHFNASANFHLGVDTRIGPIRVLGIDCGTLHLVVRIDTGMNVALDPSLFRMGIDGSFNFEGLGFSIPTVSLSVAPSSLKELPGKIIQQIKDHADQMFAALFADVQKWAEMIARGLVAVTDMANALKNAYNKTAQEAAQLMKVANQAAGTVASGLKTAYGLTEDAAASAMKNAGYTADQVAAGLRQGYTLTAQAAITALKGAGYAADQVGNALKSAYGQSAQQVAQPLQQAGYAADQVGNALKTAFGVSAVQATQILRGAGFAANQAGSALKSAYGQTAEQTAIALRQAGYGANEVGDVLKSTFGQTVQQAAQLLKGAGYTADQVGSALKTAFGLSALQATQILRSAGFAANQVGSALKSAYGQTAQQTAAALRLLGYGANEVGDVLKSTFGQTPQQAAQVLKAAGYTVDQVGNALRTACGATADVVASALKGAGYAVDQVGNFVKNAFNLGPDALKSVLQGAGYAGDQIGGFFKSLGGQFADAFKSVGNALNPTKW